MSHHMALPSNTLSSGIAGAAATGRRGLAARDTTATNGTTSNPTAPTGSGTSSGTSSTNSLDTTFLSLLVQELQNQDPTAPMDSTAMVGQMISLNQLDQLTSINQTLSTAYGGTSTTAASSSAGTGSGLTGAVRSASGAQANTLPATQAALQMLSANAAARQAAVSPSVSLPAF